METSAENLIGAGTVSALVLNGVVALFLGVRMSAVILRAVLFQSILLLMMELYGLRTKTNGLMVQKNQNRV